MINQIIEDLIGALNQNIDERNMGEPDFDKNQYNVFPLNKDCFHKIDANPSPSTMVFIDGGNQEILGAPNFSIQLNRIYFNMFSGKKRVIQTNLPHRIEFFSATFSALRSGIIMYDKLVFPLEEKWNSYLPLEEDLSFSSADRAVMAGTMRDDIQRVASIARRFAEWKYSNVRISS